MFSPLTHAVSTMLFKGVDGPIHCMVEDSDYTKFVCTRCAIFSISPDGKTTTMLTGNEAYCGFRDGECGDCAFMAPAAMVIDKRNKCLYLCDYANHALRRVHLLSGAMETIVGNGLPGYRDGVGQQALLYYPKGMVMDGESVIFVADSMNHCIRRVEVEFPSTQAKVSTVQIANGRPELSLGGFKFPMGMALDHAGAIIVADCGNNNIKKVSIHEGVYTAVTLADCQDKPSEDANPVYHDSGSDQPGFLNPTDLTIDANNNIIVADTGNCLLRVISAEGIVSTLAGTLPPKWHRRDDGIYFQETVDASDASVRFNRPHNLLLDHTGLLYVCDGHGDMASSVRTVQCDLLSHWTVPWEYTTVLDDH